jgi:hypothetical protein
MLFTWLMNKSGLGRAAVIGGIALMLLATAALAAAFAMTAHRGALADARQSGRDERDAHWRAEIAASNAKVEAERAEAARAAADAEARLAAETKSLTDQLLTLEARNASLPDARACGLSRDRVRMLP